MIGLLTTGQPFDLELTLKCAQGHRWLRDAGGGCWYTTVIGTTVVHIRQVGGPDGTVQFCSRGNRTQMEARLRHQFRLDDNVEAICTDLSRRDDRMAALVNRYRSLRVMRVDPWECLVFFILARNVEIRVTHDRIESISEKFSPARPPLWNGRYPFPPAKAVGSLSGRSKLDRLSLGFREAASNIYNAGKAIYEAGKAVQATYLYFDRLVAFKSSKAAIEELREMRGVGPKTANCVALFGLEMLEAFPIDRHVRRAMEALYDHNADDLPPMTRPGDWGQYMKAVYWAQGKFGPYVGYASQFLFMHDYEG